jgi:hypothetical protein
MILILLYSGVLWHTFRGSKFTFVYIIATLLILANFSLIVTVIDDKWSFTGRFTTMDTVVSSLLNGLYGLTQCVSHLLLAFKYRQVAKEMPYAIEEV